MKEKKNKKKIKLKNFFKHVIMYFKKLIVVELYKKIYMIYK